MNIKLTCAASGLSAHNLSARRRCKTRSFTAVTTCAIPARESARSAATITGAPHAVSLRQSEIHCEIVFFSWTLLAAAAAGHLDRERKLLGLGPSCTRPRVLPAWTAQNVMRSTADPAGRC